MARTVLEFFPAGGGASIVLTTGNDAAYRLLNLEGIGPLSINPQSIKSPSQVGVTAVDAIVPARTVVAQLLMQAGSSADMWPLRTALARAMVQAPVRRGETLTLGRLRLTSDGRPALELDVLPRSGEIERPRGRGFLQAADLEWLAPNPYWRETSDSRLDFTTDSGGFEFELEYPLDMTSNNVEQEVDNQGDVDAPVLIRIYGEVDTARMINVTTGETIEISGVIEDDEYIEIQTGFGQKAVTLVNTGTLVRTNAMDRLNLALADFWSLRPGLQTVKFEADLNTSGRAELFWRQRYSGV